MTTPTGTATAAAMSQGDRRRWEATSPHAAAANPATIWIAYIIVMLSFQSPLDCHPNLLHQTVPLLCGSPYRWKRFGKMD